MNDDYIKDWVNKNWVKQRLNEEIIWEYISQRMGHYISRYW